MLWLAACATQPPSAPVDHRGGGTSFVTVRQGESIYDIAQRTGAPLADLIAANDLKPPYRLQTGQRLRLPLARFHVVLPGDTLWGIARRYGTTIDALVRLNRLASADRIYVDQRLRIPGSVALAEGRSPTPSAKPGPDRAPQTRSKAGEEPRRPPAAPPQTAASAVPGQFIWPLQGQIVSTFGPKEGGLFNDGVNIAAAAGTPVTAAAAGRVAYVGNELKGFGNLVLVRHADGWVTAYAHLMDFAVRKDDQLRQGQMLGRVGATGSVRSPQLHFEIRRNRAAVDPLKLLGAAS